MESIPGQFEHLTEEEQKAWHKVASDLIFVNDPHIDLTRANADQISEAIQQEMLELPITQRGKIKTVEKAIQQAFEKLGIDPEGVEVSGEETRTLDSINHLAFANASDPYQDWGFTPKLAEDSKGGSSLNCLGRAIALGTELKDEGFAVRMAITPDHPYIVVEFENKHYLLGYNKSGSFDIENITESKEGFEIVRIPEDKDHNGQPRVLLVTDFNKAVLHEILENIAVLEQASKGKELYFLPNTDSKREELLAKHKNVLEAADWKLIQGKIFPDMQHMFESEEWRTEVLRMQNLRDEQHRTKFWINAFQETFEILRERYQGTQKKISRTEIVQQTKLHPTWMYEYVTGTIPMSDDIPLELLVFADVLKTNLAKENAKMQEALKARLRENLRI